MLKKLFKQQKGVTFTEIVIYIGVVSVISVSIISIIVQLVNLKFRADSLSIISHEATNVLDEIVNAERNCDSFVVTEAGTLQVTRDGTTAEYYLQNEEIFVNEGEEDYQLTSNLVSVSSLTFTDWTSTSSDNLVYMEFTIVRGGENEQFQTTVHKR